MRNRTKVIALAAITVTLAGGSTVAAASATTGGSAHRTPTKHVATSVKREASRPAADAALAGRLGVSPARLDRALRAAKRSLVNAKSGPTREDFLAVLARELGVPLARVRQAFPAPAPAGSKRADAKRVNAQRSEQQGHAELAAAVARALHVSTARVLAAFRPLFAAGRADTSSPIFVNAARALGVSAEQLNAAVIQAKQSLSGGK